MGAASSALRFSYPAACALSVLLATAMARGPAAGPVAKPPSAGRENLALDKTYTLWPQPSYHLCTDAEDGVQLTDGKSTKDYFWTQKGTVGWSSAPYAVVTVDLGKVQPIAGASMTTAAGVAGVTWPAAVHVLTSDDGKTFRDAGDLVALDRKRAGPWPKGYAIRRLATDGLATRGRFVQLVVIPPAGGPYIFTDEIEVHRGPDELLQKEPAGPPVAGAAQLFVHWRTRSSVANRFDADAAGLEKAIRGADLPDSARQGLLDRLAEVRKGLDPDAVKVDASFRAVLPLNEAHARLFGVQAALWKAMGRPGLSAWTAAAWDPLDPFAPPPGAGDRPVEVHAMLGEHRAAAVNVANAGAEPVDLAIRFEGLPGSPAPACVAVHEVAWTDTGRGVPVAAALPEARREGDAWQVRVLPGLVRQVWFDFRPTDAPPGGRPAKCEGRVVLAAGADTPAAVPVRLHVYPMELPKQPSLLLGGWDYSNGPGAYGITPANRKEFLKHLQDRFVNAPWAGAGVLMNFKFVPGYPERIELDTREFDQWVADWPKARAYFVFLALGDWSRASRPQFAGAALGTPEFDRRAGAWITAWVKYLKSKGIAPGQLGLLIHDEPHEGSDVSLLVGIARAVRAAQPEVLIWEDPTYQDPRKAPAELFDACHVLCPNRPMWLAGGKAFEDFYVAQRGRGKTLHSYSCSGPARLLDPYAYYRLQAWHCWRYGGTGSFFWAFGDNSGASSWNEYLAKAGPFTPLFLDDATVTAGKQMEAVRESVEDYETLAMLRGAVARAKAAGRSGAALQAAESLLTTAAAEVLDAKGASGLNWHDAKDRAVADRARVKALESILSLR